MPRKSGSSKSNASTRPMTRSRSGASSENNVGDNGKEGKNRTAEITYYTKMKDPSISSTAKGASKAGILLELSFIEITAINIQKP